MTQPTPEKLAWMREHYRSGMRVKLIHMNDPYRPDLKEGAMGTVIAVDDVGTIHIAWDCGSSLGVAYGEDFCTVMYLQRYGDKETYIRRETAFSTYAFVTADGAWHEQGRMGWFGFDDATNGSMKQKEKEFQAYLQEARENGLAITIVDCHI